VDRRFGNDRAELGQRIDGNGALIRSKRVSGLGANADRRRLDEHRFAGSRPAATGAAIDDVNEYSARSRHGGERRFEHFGAHIATRAGSEHVGRFVAADHTAGHRGRQLGHWLGRQLERAAGNDQPICRHCDAQCGKRQRSGSSPNREPSPAGISTAANEQRLGGRLGRPRSLGRAATDVALGETSYAGDGFSFCRQYLGQPAAEWAASE
jgi:hypothetical protein